MWDCLYTSKADGSFFINSNRSNAWPRYACALVLRGTSTRSHGNASKMLDFKIILICSGDLQYLLEYIFKVHAAKAPRTWCTCKCVGAYHSQPRGLRQLANAFLCVPGRAGQYGGTCRALQVWLSLVKDLRTSKTLRNSTSNLLVKAKFIPGSLLK